MQDFRNLEVWKRAHRLVLAVYRCSQEMPRDEVFGITMQLRRGATAIATRIAEGCGREGNADFAADLRRAVAACNEVEYLILLAKDLEYLKAEVDERLTGEVVEVRKMLHGLLRKL
ncbi:MAG TPA: four helix bundle protein [Acidobacteriaceae bacterium]|nr:four helix bundle protein [Acidobacteriaceae bacterium]